MKKSIKIIICFLILLNIMQVSVFAADDMKNWDVEKIVTYYETYGKDGISAQSDHVLDAWVTTFQDSGKVSVDTNDRYFKCLAAITGERVLRAWPFAKDTDLEVILGKSDINYWKPTSAGTNTRLTKISGRIVGIVQVFGSVVSLFVLVVIGIKYVLGSASEKAKYKEVMIPYIVGCVLLFATSNIASIIYKFATTL